jgi:hypothetical protein
MSTTVIDPAYNWKQAASNEAVDYQAVTKTFMDQAYGFVANKARVLFQDPYRLGFEIVYRNEKATRMVGKFSFRVNENLLQVPVFFMNGEIKPADMIYRYDVKRFVPLTEEWCDYLVKGANQEMGALIDKGRQRQADGHMQRLAYPQHTKYASSDAITKVASEFFDLLDHCANAPDPELLLPRVMDAGGPDVMEKLAELLESSTSIQEFVAENYDLDSLTKSSAWLHEKKAAAVATPVIVVHYDIAQCKSASQAQAVAARGFVIEDIRPDETINHVIREIDDAAVSEVTNAGAIELYLADGSTVEGLVLNQEYGFMDGHTLHDDRPSYYSSKQQNKVCYIKDDKSVIKNRAFFSATHPETKEIDLLKVQDLDVGKAYMAVDKNSLICSRPYMVTDITVSGKNRKIGVSSWNAKKPSFHWYYGGELESDEHSVTLGDDIGFLEVGTDKRDSENEPASDSWDETPSTTIPMSARKVGEWITTGGGLAKSHKVSVEKQASDEFTIVATKSDGSPYLVKNANPLTAQLKLAVDFDMTCDAAGNILELVNNDRNVHFQVYDTAEKSAYYTQAMPEQQWVEQMDPRFGVRTTTPETQTIMTHTPQRARQYPQYGDHFDRGSQPDLREDNNLLPRELTMTKSPEELADMAAKYNLPHIFDHGVIGMLSNSVTNVAQQIHRYIPELEAGVDSYFRILFLLRYRPADFEEAYGQDEVMEMEHEISEIANITGKNLLRLLKKFDPAKISSK